MRIGDFLQGASQQKLPGLQPNTTIMLLVMGEPEFTFCSEMLRNANPALLCLHILTRDDLRQLGQLPPAFFTHCRLLGFCTNIIIPADILILLDGNAYNFHPGPPHYPGSHPAAFALYEQATSFGVTCHQMAAKVDSGAICKTVDFAIDPTLALEELTIKSYSYLAQLFVAMAEMLAFPDQPIRPSGEKWSGTARTQAQWQAMLKIEKNTPAGQKAAEDWQSDYWQRRLRAFPGLFCPVD